MDILISAIAGVFGARAVQSGDDASTIKTVFLGAIGGQLGALGLWAFGAGTIDTLALSISGLFAQGTVGLVGGALMKYGAATIDRLRRH